MVRKIIYIVLWSLGLFWATFPEGFSGGINFNFYEMDMQSFFKKYMFPLLMALLLYMLDIIYTFHLEGATGGPKKPNLVYIFTGGFLLCFILSVATSGTIFAVLFFGAAWLCLMVMKYFKTEQRGIPTPLNVVAVPED